MAMEEMLQFVLLNIKKICVYFLLFLVAIALVIALFTRGPSAREVAAAKVAVAEWMARPEPLSEKKMRAALKKVPGLAKAYEAQIAQRLLAMGAVAQAKPQIERCIARLAEESPEHALFAKASLLIEEQKFQEALEQSVQLKGQIDRKGEPPSPLYWQNLLRIAFLQKQLHNQPGELAAWEEVKSLRERAPTEASQFLDPHFQTATFSLADFISQRENVLVR